MLSRYGVISPLSPLWGVSSNRLESTMNRLFQDFETAFNRPVLAQSVRRAAPRVQLQDRGDGIALLADLPGSKLADVELSVEGQAVSLKVSPKQQPAPEGFAPLRRERRPAAVNWSFELPYPIDASAAAATLEQGRLIVTLPKAPEAKPRNIPVKAG
jgi:HSP20 family protein